MQIDTDGSETASVEELIATGMSLEVAPEIHMHFIRMAMEKFH